MPELELTRTPEDRNVYALDGVGRLWLKGWLSKGATVEARDRSYEISRRGLFAPVTEATDAAGTTIGTFRGRTIKRGGTLTWAGKEYTLRPASLFKERYALTSGDQELATIDGKGWGKRPVAIAVDDATPIDPGLLLFAAFVVRGLAEDASSAAGGASAAATG
ncbi:hypothetical protein DSM104299_03790 [Baekduia alba]|uniref:hypothetical protein n=1 Tax=Baekduia alba TaxID=2997333 RepID=UPI00233FE87D|nr:hypothetical protein [Baekduia alba]WCB95048.1 hypothetical protein DSM104299_03790 [Baekduia alba]